jgi:tetratricopeptide (TPR) repeat protein
MCPHRPPIDRAAAVVRALVAAVTVALLAAAGPAAKKEPRRSDFDRLDAYLQRLGLFELQVRNLERELARHGSDEEATAEHLVEIFANRRLTTTDAAALADLDRRLEALLKQYPKAQTPAIEVILLEGDYNRAEARALKWVDEPDRIADRDAALAILDRVVPAVDTIRDTLLREVTEGTKQMEKMADGGRRNTLENHLQGVAEVAGRATYFSGWANYYRNLIKPMGLRGDDGFKAARTCFRKLLGVEDGAEPTTDTLELESQAQARLALGMGLAELSCGNPTTSHAFFEALRSKDVHASVRGWADYWEVWALLRAGRTPQAREQAEKAINRFTPDDTAEKGLFCKLLIQAGDTDAQARALGALGIRGLLRMQRIDLARQLMQKYHVEDDGSITPAGLWILGQLRLEKAEANKARADYEAAAQAFQAVLSTPGIDQEPRLAAESRFALGCSHYRTGDYAQALDELKRAAKELATSRAATAPDAAWMVALTMLKIASTEGKDLAPAIAAFRAFQQQYPDHPNTRMIDSLVAQLNKDSAPADKTPGTDPPAPADRLEALRRSSRRWQALDTDARRKSALPAAIRRDVDEFLNSPESAGKPESTFEVLLMSATLAMRTEPADLARARADLTKAEPIASSLGEDSSLLTEFHLAQLQLAAAGGDATAARAQAQWLVEHRKGTDTEKVALSALARLADEAAAKAAPADRDARVAEAFEAFRRLVEVMGDTPESLRSDRNALVASSRLAQHALDSGHPELASRQLDKLLRAYPTDATYLRRAGLAHFAAGQHERALECWRLLVAGLSPDSDPWFEAKYYQLASLSHLDPTRARAALDQFKLLHPDLGPERWRNKLRALETSSKP